LPVEERVHLFMSRVLRDFVISLSLGSNRA
jgi:hypothetical protein